MRHLIVTLLSLVVGLPTLAAAAPKKDAKGAKNATTTVPVETKPEFYIDKGVLDKVYDTTVENQRQTAQANGDIRMEVALGILSPSEMTVANDYFEVDHAANGGGLPFLGFSAARKLATRGRNDFFVEADVGYGTRQAEYEVQSTVGIEVEDLVTLQWMPVACAARVEHRPTFTSVVKPSLTAGAGAVWLNQRGTLEGMNQSYWLPSWSVGPALTFFGGDEHDESAFGGVVAAALYQKSANASATVAGWAFSLGSRVHL